MSSSSTLAAPLFGGLLLAAIGLIAHTPDPPVRNVPGPTQAERWAWRIERATTWGELERCVAASPDERARLALATVAVESYLRPAWIREAEFAYAWTGWRLTGRLPDLSLGVAQMRPSTAARVFADDAASMSSDALWAALNDTCRSVGLAAAFFADRPPGEAPEVALAAYNGQRRMASREAPTLYAEVVLRLAQAR